MPQAVNAGSGWRRRTALLAALALPGCTLVDQRTFNPAAGQAPAKPTAPPPPPALAPETGSPALLSLRLPASGDWRGDVARAVAAARARKKDVVFDVVEITSGTQAGAEAAEVARAITAQGVPSARVRLAARPVPDAAREVRVYVH